MKEAGMSFFGLSLDSILSTLASVSSIAAHQNDYEKGIEKSDDVIDGKNVPDGWKLSDGDYYSPPIVIHGSIIHYDENGLLVVPPIYVEGQVPYIDEDGVAVYPMAVEGQLPYVDEDGFTVMPTIAVEGQVQYTDGEGMVHLIPMAVEGKLEEGGDDYGSCSFLSPEDLMLIELGYEECFQQCFPTWNVIYVADPETYACYCGGEMQ
jgi:hypothetical protein